MAHNKAEARRAWVRAVIATLAIVLAVVAGVASAQAGAAGVDGRAGYDIPAQSLRAALDAFARQSGLQVSAEARLTADRGAPAVSGRYTPGEALDRLLSESDLSWSRTGDTIVIEPASAPVTDLLGLGDDEAMMLAPVMVEGAAMEIEADTPYQTPGSSAYIGREEIERNRGMSVGDIFQGTTGVMVAENRNSGGLNVNIRGMQGQGRVPVLVDGSRQETTVYRGYAGATSRSYVDPDLIGDIEIDKGPSMGPYGTGATGGVVSMNTLEADDIAKQGNTWGVLMRGSLIGNNSDGTPASGTPAGYGVGRGGRDFGGPDNYRVDCQPGLSLCDGPYDIANAYGSDATMDRPSTLDPNGHAASIAATRRFESIDLVAAYAQRKQGNYYAGTKGDTPELDLSERYDRGFYTEVRPDFTGQTRFRGGEQVVNTQFDSESILLKSSFYLPAEQTFELSYLRYDSEYGELMPSQLLWLDKARQTEASTVTANSYTSHYQWQPVDNDWFDIDAHVWHTDTTSRNNGYSEEVRQILSQTTGTESYKRFGADVTNTTRFSALGDFQLKYGLTWQNERVEPADEPIRADSLLRDGERNESSAFAAIKWTFLPRLTLDAGIRYTRFDVEDNKPVIINAQESNVCRDADGDLVCDSQPDFSTNEQSGSAPMASLTWEPLDGLQFYAKYAEGLRMPSLFESTSGFSVAPAPGVDLKPERTKNTEFGANLLKRGLFASDDVLRVKLAHFNNRTEDYLTRTISNTWEGTDVGLGGALFRVRNIDSVEFKGTELTLEYDGGWVFAKAGGTRYSDIETCLTGSFRRQRCTDYGIASSYINNMIPPNYDANALLGFRLFDESVEFGGRVNWVGERNEVPEFNNETEIGPGSGFAEPVPWRSYRIIDVFATWQPNDTFSLDFNIDNITDEYYLDALSLGLVPAPGRTARLSGTLHF